MIFIYNNGVGQCRVRTIGTIAFVSPSIASVSRLTETQLHAPPRTIQRVAGRDTERFTR